METYENTLLVIYVLPIQPIQLMLLFKFLGIEFDFKPLVEEVQGWWGGFLGMLPNMILAFLVAMAGYIVTSFLKKYFDKLSGKLVRDKTISSLLSTMMTVGLSLLFLLLILSVLNLSGAVSSILGAAGVVGLAVGLAFQDPILNFFSGIQLTVRHLFRIGDLIEVGGYKGTVMKITLRHTAIETFQGQDVMIPNKIVVQSALTNYTMLKRRRVDLACGVSYGDDLSKVKEVTIKAIEENVNHDADRGVQLFFNEFGGSSVNYSLRFWMDNRKTAQGDFLQVQSDAIMAIMTAYNENDIMIPFPIRTLDFGIRGGEKLASVLASVNKVNGKSAASEK